MKWFLIQSIGLAVAAFGLGALFHRLLWKKASGVSSSSNTAVNKFGSGANGVWANANGDAGAARLAELQALRAEHTKVVADRDAKTKEFAALSFEHSAAKSVLAEREASLASLHGEIESARGAATAAASAEIQGLVAKVDTNQSTIDELNAKLVAANHDNDEAIATLRGDYDGRLAALAGEHESAFVAARGEHDGQVATLSADHQTLVVGLRADHDRAIQETHGDRDRTLSGLRSDHEKALGELRRRAETAEADLAKAVGDCAACDAELARLRAELDSKHGEVQGLVSNLESTKLGVADDLEVIEGIGPAMAKALNADGIQTFEALAGADQVRLRSAVETAGLKFAPSIPTWSKQAAYLVAGDQDGFTAYTDYLIAGVDPAGLSTEAGNDGRYGSGEVQSFAAGSVDYGSDDAFEGDDVAGDDLLQIEGIGPKINEILMAGGVRTFRRLAAMPEDRVRAIVTSGGVSFFPSANTWAAQAALLRDGDEAGFQALVERLVAGRDDAR